MGYTCKVCADILSWVEDYERGLLPHGTLLKRIKEVCGGGS